MKRVNNDREEVRQDIIRLKPIMAFDLPEEVIKKIVAEILLDDLSISFVSKAWYKVTFFHFKRFQIAYHQCMKCFNESPKNISDLSQALEMLRNAVIVLDQDMQKQGDTKKPYEYLKKNFLRRHFTSLQLLAVNPDNLKTHLELFPEKLIELSLLHLWAGHKPDYHINIAVPEIPVLGLFLPSKELRNYFSNRIDDKEILALATELASRNAHQCISKKAKDFYDNGDYQLAANLYELVLSKATLEEVVQAANAHANVNNMMRAMELYDFCPINFELRGKIDNMDYRSAATFNFDSANWQQAAAFYEQAFVDDPQNYDSDYVNAGYAEAKLGNSKEAAIYFRRYFRNPSLETCEYLPDTMEVVLNTFTKEQDEEMCNFMREKFISPKN